MSTIGNGAPYWLWTGGVNNGSGGGGWKQPTVEENVMAFGGVSKFQVQEPAMQFVTEMMDVSQHSYDFHEHDDFNPDAYLASYSKPRLKWTAELHDHFVNAVNALGGPYSYTQSNFEFDVVPGLTLYHLKSHLQKYRLGKVAKRLCKTDHALGDNGCKSDAKLSSITQQSNESSLAKTFVMNGSPDECRVDMVGTQMYETADHLIEKQNATQAIAMEGISTTTPALLRLFRTGESGINSQSRDFPEWFEILDQNPVISHPVEGSSMETNLNTYSFSNDFASVNGHVLGQANMGCGRFFDDLASFLKVDANALATNDGFLPMVASGFSAGVTNYCPGL